MREVAVAVRERPILFQGAMVRALLAGTKTQTRRAVKYPAADGECGWHPIPTGFQYLPGGSARPVCPYGKPGDRLWVREAFIHEPADYCWEASVSIPSRPASTVYRADFPDSKPGEGWKPSIHLPRNLSRIDLEITEIRVERLWDISEADARAEGWDGTVLGYAKLWDQINGAGSWDANPWVWAVSFRRVATA